MYGNRCTSEGAIKPRPDMKAHREHHHKTESAHKSYTRDAALPRGQIPDQESRKPSRSHLEAPADASTDSSPSTTLDFGKMKLSPRKYMHNKGGNSGLSKISSMSSPVAPQQPSLLSQSDYASDLSREVRQRYGKDPRHKGDRNFDYGLK